MKTRVLYFIGCIIIIGFVSSCSSIRRLKSSSETGGLVKREYIEKLVSQTSEWDCLTGKVALKLQNKEKTTKVNATLRLKKGEVIQLSMAPLLGIEVGGNRRIVEGLATLGVEAFVITLACVLGSCILAWGLWYLLYKKKGEKA